MFIILRGGKVNTHAAIKRMMQERRHISIPRLTIPLLLSATTNVKCETHSNTLFLSLSAKETMQVGGGLQ